MTTTLIIIGIVLAIITAPIWLTLLFLFFYLLMLILVFVFAMIAGFFALLIEIFDPLLP